MLSGTSYLTAEGKVKLQEELENLKGPAREDLSRRLRIAIEQGDLSENADYISAKEEQGFLEGRIQELEQILKNAKIIDELEKNHNEVGIGDYVTIQEKEYPPETFYLVGPKEANPRNGRISYESPIGRVLIGHKVNDKVEAETPGGKIIFKILKIE